jgi:serine/threonine protein phosphatase PrpC
MRWSQTAAPNRIPWLVRRTAFVFTPAGRVFYAFMELTCTERSIQGPVRPNNEDLASFLQPESLDERRIRGSVALLADGVGGEERGELASRLAIGAALKAFGEAEPDIAPATLLGRMFSAANLAVYDAAHYGEHKGKGPMSTTLAASLFRHDLVAVAHVGDTRIYHLRGETLTRLTTDHSYVSLEVKLGLVSERDAMTSRLRSVLTRSLGHEPVCRVTYGSQSLEQGDIIVQCTDGLYACVIDDEIREVVSHHAPPEACDRLIALAERRGADDNISVQIITVRAVEMVNYLRGAPIYYRVPDRVATASDVTPGQVLDDRYEIQETISRSGMASIFKAGDRESGRAVAIKVPHMQFESDIASYQRFEREEAIGLSLDHPSVLKILPGPEHKSRPYIVMEFLEGQTLAEVLGALRPLPEKDAVGIASRVCEALEYLHEHNVIHRDLKPQNIMLCADGSVRLMDFGIAKAERARRLTWVGFSPTLGTPDYMAPEQVKGRRGDERTDIYSLGAILYEMTTGSAPFEGESPYVIMNARLTGDPVAPRKLNPALTPQIEEITLHALARDPGSRYRSAAGMKADLDHLERVELTERHQRLESPQIWRTRWRLGPLIAGFVILQIFLVLLFYVIFRR